jgi:hypothetical protein
MTAPAGTFTAWQTCPSCGLYAVHRMRPPVTYTPADREAAAVALTDWERDRFRYELAGGEVLRLHNAAGQVVLEERPGLRPRPAELVDESAYEVFRQCTCGHEWGIRK